MRLGPHQIDTTGATDGDALVYDAATDKYGPGAVSGVPTSRAINTDSTLTGGGDLTADRTLGVDTSAEAERIRDVIGAALVAGTNITITVNDAGDTITIAVTGVPSGTRLIPLTTVIGGVPDFVWDADNELVLTEVP